MKLSLFMIDIDGCVADGRARYAASGPEPEGSKTSAAYKRWVSTVMDQKQMALDPPVPGMADILDALHVEGHIVAFVTSREEMHRAITEKWLDDNGFLEFGMRVIMRPQGSLLPDHELKEKAVDTLIAEFRPEAVVIMDDDLRGGLAKVCKKNGWTMLKVQGFSL